MPSRIYNLSFHVLKFCVLDLDRYDSFIVFVDHRLDFGGGVLGLHAGRVYYDHLLIYVLNLHYFNRRTHNIKSSTVLKAGYMSPHPKSTAYAFVVTGMAVVDVQVSLITLLKKPI